ncbi:protein-lysine N-methyltransferase [Aspergillus lucknowensis]|uniref:Methyltransferase-domain-containing protein n=1 Tax=Aspergillus lucknowensis TaxID=176173 RepID=A0ABR4LK37_9EURO
MEGSIALLRAQYFEQVDPPNLSLPDGPALVSPAMQTAIYKNMFNENTAWPLPPAPYQARVLKAIIARIEESISDPDEDEILDALLEKWSSLLSAPKPSAVEQAQELTYIKYTAPTLHAAKPIPDSRKHRTVITSESRSLILASGTTGFRTWEAALHLGTFLSTTSHGESLLANKRVLELGAGTGFLSFLTAKYLGAESVLATDRDPALIEQIDACIGKNGLDKSMVRTGIWEWGSPLQVPSFSEGEGAAESEVGFDVALGADLIYDVDLVPLLVSTVKDLFNNYSLKEFIISATVRNGDTFRTFLETCERNRLAVEQIPFTSPPRETQTGFFHSTSIPIRTYRVQAMS